MKKFFLTMFLCLSFWGYSQGENDNWYFGQNIALNFAGINPQISYNSSMISNVSSGTVSDSNGNLLFYTNGEYVWNRQHQVMQNGNITQEATQISIVKHPTNSNLYYIFSTNIMGYVARYSLVDMSLGNIVNGQPLGAIAQNFKNVPILNELGNEFTNARGITIVPHGNGNSFWVLLTTGTKLYSYHLSSSGLSNTPIVNNLNTTGFYTYYNGVSLKASPKINACNFSHFLSITNVNTGTLENEGLICSFNNFSGLITSDYNLSIASIGPLYTEFNKNANILYIAKYANGISTNEMIYKFDLLNSTNGNIIYSPLDTGQADLYNQGYVNTMQRNTKGDIYFYLPYYNSGSEYLGKIINPDIYAISSVDLNGIDLTSYPDNAIYVGATNNLPQLLPNLQESGINSCLASIHLSTQETNMTYNYQVSNTITTDQNYSISSGANIAMKAGNSIVLLPDTYIQYGANYLAQIENCNCSEGGAEGKNQNLKNKMFLDLRSSTTKNLNRDNKKIKISPNPTSDILNIKTDSKINSISVVDMTGRKVNVKLEGKQVDVRELPAGNYLINIETKEGISTEKFIKK